MSVRTTRILIVLVSALLFLPFLGGVRLFDWDEVNFAECAREMIVTGDYMHMQIDFRPFYEKPPIFIWLQVLCMKLVGVNEFAARLPNALLGIVTMLVLHSIGTRLYSNRMGILWCVVYAGSLLPTFYFHSGIIDPLFNLFIFLSVWWMLKSTQQHYMRNALIAGVFAGAAVMTKGPVGFGLVMLTTGIAWIVLRRSMPLPWKHVLVASATTIGTASIWFIVDYIQNGPTFIMENLAYQVRLLTTGDAGHEQPWYYHPVVVAIGCYPASMLIGGGIRSTIDETPMQRMMRVWMIVLGAVVLVVFSLVKTKIVHYSSMTYLPLTFLAALALERMYASRGRWKLPTTIGLSIVGVVLTAATVLVPWAFQHRDELLALPSFRDRYLRAAIMRDVDWIGIEPWIGSILLLGLVGAWLLQRRGKLTASIGVLFGSVMLFVALFLPLVAPRIEPYTQGAALDFYESLAGKDVYVKPLTMKSYAHLFYTNKPQELSGAARGIALDNWEPWLLEGNIDKPAYFVARITDADAWRTHPSLRVLREEGGFVIFQRVTSADSLQRHSR
jgi:hypothetical protein